jgi:regulatory protein
MTGRITSITRQKGDKARASIFLEGEFAFGVEEQTVEEFRLRKGDHIDNELYGKLIDFDFWIGAKRIALRYVNHHARSEKEVRTRLDREEIPSAIIQRVIDFLKSYNMLDDVAYAKSFVNDKLLRKQVSSRDIEHELQRRGISKTIILNTLESLNAEESDETRAMKAAEKRWPRLLKEEPDARRRKLYTFLGARGFSPDIIKTIFKKLSIEETED